MVKRRSWTFLTSSTLDLERDPVPDDRSDFNLARRKGRGQSYQPQKKTMETRNSPPQPQGLTPQGAW